MPSNMHHILCTLFLFIYCFKVGKCFTLVSILACNWWGNVLYVFHGLHSTATMANLLWRELPYAVFYHRYKCYKLNERKQLVQNQIIGLYQKPFVINRVTFLSSDKLIFLLIILCIYFQVSLKSLDTLLWLVLRNYCCLLVRQK